ncbi:hypothetical protein G4H71_09325 [Rhodococcus triatomae]|uniref:Uncharacterized protein n=1 Tax=Rhodococcus triatomae TaxID=300028 RepID=A0A1G8HUZ0_9NOCA|nr:hypothetical protein [Rhodococcus triatomae]QNG20882.1 hypothetical protein G4H72_21060 [Rhodococcus triatomae]QNG23203.1 hypothetical protein G4H71_09325 [Rhodococcus triatomae]SDI10290.1 hypothetical protein SAMN05444695_10571 [Rhodococcus triatomae]
MPAFAPLTTARTVAYVAAALVVLQTLTRTWIAANSGYYWDDLILTGRGGTLPLWSSDLLVYSHDGHLMPAAFWVAAVTTKLAPYEWALPALTLIVGQLLASLAVLRLLTLILGRRPALLVPLTLYLFVPLTVPAFTWWAAALNTLPMQIALAWVAGDAIRLYRTGRVRYAVSGIAVTVAGLLFFEKSVAVPFVAFATVALLLHVDGTPAPLRATWQRCRALWIGALATLAIWLVAYLSIGETHIQWASPRRAFGLLHHGTSYGIVPTLLGGPWSWTRWLPSPPWATPPTLLVVVSWIVVIAAVTATVLWKRRVGWVWSALAVYYLGSVAAMILARWGDDTAYELAQTLRYFTDTAVVLAIAVALVFRAPTRDTPTRYAPTGDTPTRYLKRAPVLTASRRVAAASVVGVLFVVSSLVSTVTYVRSWQEGPTPQYLENARQSLAEHSDVPLLDQQASIFILMPVTYPHNKLSTMLAPFRERGEFADSTTELRLLDGEGHLVDAEVLWTRGIEEGTAPGCGHRIEGSEWTTVPLNGPLVGWEWVAQLNYLVGDDGEIEVSLAEGDPVRVPVTAGLGTVYVKLIGGGDSLRIRPVTPGLTLCLASGPVGPPAPKQN